MLEIIASIYILQLATKNLSFEENVFINQQSRFLTASRKTGDKGVEKDLQVRMQERVDGSIWISDKKTVPSSSVLDP